jgi:hypothetical protein
MTEDSIGKKIYKTARWVILVGLIGTIFFALRIPAPPTAVQLAPERIKEQAAAFESKLSEIEQAQQRGEAPAPAEFSSEELNSFISEASARSAATPQPGLSPEEQETRAQIKSTQVAFVGDEVIAQALTERYGQDIYITVRGRLGAENGYLKFIPTEFKIGELAVPVSLVRPQLEKKLNEPEIREKLKLPEFVGDLRIENSKLMMVPK